MHAIFNYINVPVYPYICGLSIKHCKNKTKLNYGTLKNTGVVHKDLQTDRYPFLAVVSF